MRPSPRSLFGTPKRPPRRPSGQGLPPIITPLVLPLPEGVWDTPFPGPFWGSPGLFLGPKTPPSYDARLSLEAGPWGSFLWSWSRGFTPSRPAPQDPQGAPPSGSGDHSFPRAWHSSSSRDVPMSVPQEGHTASLPWASSLAHPPALRVSLRLGGQRASGAWPPVSLHPIGYPPSGSPAGRPSFPDIPRRPPQAPWVSPWLPTCTR